MAAMRSDNLIMTRAPLAGAFAFRRYDRGIREVLCINTPVISSNVNLLALLRGVSRKLSFHQQQMLSSLLFMTHNELKKLGG